MPEQEVTTIPYILIAPLDLLPDYEDSKAFDIAEEIVDQIYIANTEKEPATRRRNDDEKQIAVLTLLCHLGYIKEHKGMEGLAEVAVQIPFRQQQVVAFADMWNDNKLPSWYSRRTLEWVRDGMQLIGYLTEPKEEGRIHRMHIKGQHLTPDFCELMRTRLFDLEQDYPLAFQAHSAAKAIRELDDKIDEAKNPLVSRFKKLHSFNEVAAKNSIQINGYDYPMTLYAPWHSKKTGKLVKGRLKWGVRLYADPANLIAIPDKDRTNYQCFGEKVRLDASRFIHPHGALVEIDISASHLGIVKHLFCGDKSAWNGDPYRKAIFEAFPWLQCDEVELIRREMKHVCGILGTTTTGRRGACSSYTTALRKGKREGEVKGTALSENRLRDLLRVTNKKTPVSILLWDTLFNTMPEKMRVFMQKHSSDLHIVLQGIEGQIMLDIVNGIGRHALPVVMHDGILVPKSFEAVTKDILVHAYREYTKGGQVVYTVSHQIKSSEE